MSNVRPQGTPSTADVESLFKSRSSSGMPGVPPPQARSAFDDALRRADTRKPERDETREPEEGEQDHPLAAFGPLPPANPAASALAGGTEALGGAATAALPGAVPGAGPDSVPMSHAPGTLVSAGQQWRVSVPVDGQAHTALGMRLVNSGAGHWQLRLATDTQTRQQLAPHLDRLRDKLRQRSGGRMADLDFEDDAGSAA